MNDTTEQQTSTTETGTTDATAAETTEASDADAATAEADTAADDSTVLGAADADAGTGDDTDEAKSDQGDQGQADADGLPETYELTPPEGMELDTELLGEATPVFHELGLGNEQAQKLVPLAGRLIEKHETRKADEFNAIKADWAKSAQNDAEIGGKNWKRTQANAARALDHFGAEAGSDFRKLLDETGLGNHPVMIRMFSKIGEAVGEDGLFPRDPNGPALKKSREEELYPDDVPKK